MNYKITTITDKQEIANLAQRICDIMEYSYRHKGGWFCSTKPKDFIKRTSMIKYIDIEGTIIAVAVFEDRLGGMKCTGIGHGIGLNRDTYVPAVEFLIENIIKQNIEGDYLYWIEASDKVEDICKKYNGNPIPAAIVTSATNIQIDSIADDCFHYTRKIGIDDTPIRKCIYGFNSKEMYDMVSGHLNDVSGMTYETFKKRINESEILPKYRQIIVKLYEFWAYDGITEFTEEQFELMNEYRKLANDKYTVICEDIMNDSEIIKPIKKIII